MGLSYFPRLPVAMSDGWNGEKAIDVTVARWPFTKLQSGSTWWHNFDRSVKTDGNTYF